MDLRNRILAKNDVKIESVLVPEWGETMWVRSISGRERDQYEEQSLQKTSKGRREVTLRDARARLVVLAVCVSETDKTPLFNAGDIEALTGKNGAALDRLYAVAARLSGIRPEDEEEMAKNSEAAASGASGSNSPTDTAGPFAKSKS